MAVYDCFTHIIGVYFVRLSSTGGVAGGYIWQTAGEHDMWGIVGLVALINPLIY